MICIIVHICQECTIDCTMLLEFYASVVFYIPLVAYSINGTGLEMVVKLTNGTDATLARN